MFWSQSAKGWLGYFASLSNDRIALLYEQTFKGVTPEEAARAIKSFCAARGMSVPLIVAQPHIFPSSHAKGETVSETFARHGVPMMAGDDDRVNGLSRVRSWLSPRPPIFVVHPDCKYWIKTVGTLLEDPRHPDDIIDVPEAYPAHGTRLYLMSRPAPHAPKPKLTPGPGTWGYELRHVRQPPRHVIGANLR